MVPMKIATWNLDRPLTRKASKRAAIARWMREVDADVWVLTETHAEVTPGAEFSGVATLEPDPEHEVGENWTTVWSRFPIELLARTSDPSRAVAALVKAPGRLPLVV